jgi:hypothetical protein
MRVLDEEYRGEVHSIALAALGSTSHRGGDSPYFLSFREGFLTIVRAIEDAFTPPTLDRVFLVAFEEHSGTFREDALEGLQAVSAYLWVKKWTSAQGTALVTGPLLVLFVILALISYQNPRQAFLVGNRWAWAEMVFGVSLLPAGFCWGGPALLFQLGVLRDVETVLGVYSALTLATGIGVLVLSKRLRID